jgi:hypothetical protein
MRLIRDAMSRKWKRVTGLLVEGHRVAASPSQDYPYGTLVKQFPIFKGLGLDLEGYFPGTLNVSIHPLTWSMLKPDFTFRQVLWTDLHPPEDFSFTACRVCWQGSWFTGWIYYPHPETKVRHFQDKELIEIICRHLPGIQYGAYLDLELNTRAIQLIMPGKAA